MSNYAKRIIIVITLVFVLPGTQLLSQTRERADIPTEYKWKLEDLYPSDQAWEKAKDELAARFDEVTKFQGKLADSASDLVRTGMISFISPSAAVTAT